MNAHLFRFALLFCSVSLSLPAAADTFGYAAMGASETQGSNHTGSWVPYLSNERGLDFGGTGNPHNVAVGGATTGSLLNQGQHTEVRDLVLAGEVDLAYLSIGGNDFGAVATNIITGSLSGAALDAWAQQRVTNILTAVDTVLSADPLGMMVVSMPDMTLTPGGRAIASVPLFQQRGVAAVDLVNSYLKPEILSRGLVYIDFAQAMRDLEVTPLVVGGVTINMAQASTNPTHFYQDNLHPAAVGNGVIANLMMTAANIGYGAGNTLLTDFEILSRAGLAGSYTGETSNLDYSSYIYRASEQVLAVASTDNGHLLQLDANGGSTIIAQSPSLATPLDVSHDAAGNRYVVDAAQSRVIRYDSEGISTIFADGSDGLLLPTSIEGDGTGSFFIANYLTDQILLLDSAGNATLFADSSHGLESPFGLAFDASGNLFVAEVDSQRIVVLDQEGNLTLFADGSDGLVTPVALAIDAAGNLFVADAALSKIFKFDAQGNGSLYADIADGVFFPTGLAVDAAGNLFVSNYLNDTILKIDPFGIAEVFATAASGIEGPFGLDLYEVTSALGARAGLQLAAVPETRSMLLAGFGLLLIGCFLRRDKLRRAEPPVPSH